jgi:hypothetical protein
MIGFGVAHVRAAAAGEGAIEGFAKNDETRAAFARQCKSVVWG